MNLSKYCSAFSLSAFLASTVFLTGCGVTSADLAAGSASTTKAKISGSVYGGRQPVVGAHVFVMEVNTTGNGGNGIAASTVNASKSLLGNYANTTLDTDSTSPTYNDYYVTTDSNGTFSISGEYTCDLVHLVYIYVQGGNPGDGVNPVATFMGLLGTCPHTAQEFATTLPTIYINELSTVATAYALAGLATDPLHIGDRSSSSVSSTYIDAGYAEAFINKQLGMLYNISTGASVSTQTFGTTTVTSPQTRVDALANSLAACINSTGASSTACSTLLGAATVDGTDTGTPATDTADAAINIAHWPAHRVSDIFGVASATPPWQPTISDSSTLTDWVMPVSYTDPNIVSTSKIFIDPIAGVYVLNRTTATVVRLARYPTSSPTAVFSAPDATGTANAAVMFFNEDSIGVSANGALDGCFDICTENSTTSYTMYHQGTLAANVLSGVLNGANSYFGDDSGNIYHVNGTHCQNEGEGDCTITQEATVMGQANAMAFDGLGHILVAVLGVQKLTLETSSGFNNIASVSALYSDNGGVPTSMAVDAQNNIWLAYGTTHPHVWEMDNNGTPLSGTNGYSTGTVGFNSIAIDGNGLVWGAIPAYGGPSKLEVLSPTNGAILSGTGYTGGLPGVANIAIDSLGSVWVSSGANTVSQLIGLAGPVTTDPAYAASENKQGARP